MVHRKGIFTQKESSTM